MAVFTTLAKKRLSWEAPATVSGTAKFLNIGSGFNLLVATDYKLVIQPGGRQNTVWTERNKYT